MGNTWSVEVWQFIEFRNEYGYIQFWQGESSVLALWNLLKAKRAGYGCVTLHWR